MGFIDSYKRLEKLCGEVLNDDRRISAYIEEMENNTRGGYCVHTWYDDLKKLKHYRWVRNKIAHDPDFSEDNMCQPADALWLDEFYSRIMNQTDPLALYHKAMKDTYNNRSTLNQTPSRNFQYQNYKGAPANEIGCATIMMIAIVSIIVFALAMIGV